MSVPFLRQKRPQENEEHSKWKNRTRISVRSAPSFSKTFLLTRRDLERHPFCLSPNFSANRFQSGMGIFPEAAQILFWFCFFQTVWAPRLSPLAIALYSRITEFSTLSMGPRCEICQTLRCRFTNVNFLNFCPEVLCSYFLRSSPDFFHDHFHWWVSHTFFGNCNRKVSMKWLRFRCDSAKLVIELETNVLINSGLLRLFLAELDYGAPYTNEENIFLLNTTSDLWLWFNINPSSRSFLHTRIFYDNVERTFVSSVFFIFFWNPYTQVVRKFEDMYNSGLYNREQFL